jgi:hypothetical protein
MTTLGSLDSNEIGRYDETTPIGSGGTPTFSQYLNAALVSVSAAFTKYVRTKTVFKRTTGTIATSASYNAVTVGTSVIGSAFTHSAGVFTCVTAGEYRVSASLSYAANTTGNRGIRMAGSGSLGIRTFRVAASSIQDQTVGVEFMGTFAVNDTLTLQSFQDSGSTLAVLGSIVFDRLV